MKFAVLIAIVADELEEDVRSAAKKAGAGGVTILSGRGSGMDEKKSFFGLTYEGTQSVFIYILEKKLALTVLKAIKRAISDGKSSNGLAFTMPVEHLGGLENREIELFEQRIREEI